MDIGYWTFKSFFCLNWYDHGFWFCFTRYFFKCCSVTVALHFSSLLSVNIITQIDFPILKQPCSPRVNPSRLWYIISSIRCWIWFLIFWGFPYLYSEGIVVCCFLLLPLSGFGISNDFLKWTEEYFLLFCFLQHKGMKKRKKEAMKDFYSPSGH